MHWIQNPSKKDNCNLFVVTAKYSYFGATGHQQVFLSLFRLLETSVAAIKIRKDLRNRLRDSTIIDKMYHLPVCNVDYFGPKTLLNTVEQILHSFFYLKFNIESYLVSFIPTVTFESQFFVHE